MAAPDELRESLDVYWDEAVVGLAVIRDTGVFKHINKAFCELIEYSASEVEELKKFQDITHPEDIEADLDSLTKLKRGEIISYVMRKRYITKTERTIWIKLKVTKADEEGSVFIAQVSPIEVAHPPRFPGDLELQRAMMREKFSQLKWFVGMAVGAGMASIGAVYHQTALVATGSMILTGSAGGAVFEKKLK